MFNIRLDGNMKELRKSVAVYRILNINTFKVEFIGVEKLSQLFQMREFQSNHVLSKYILDNENFAFEVTDMCESKGDALRQQAFRLREAGYPEANKMAQAAQSGIIECINDGEQYTTQAEVAAAYGISQASLSKHLRNMPGNMRVGGLCFKRKKLTKM